MMLNREIISAARRLPRAAPYYPWRQEIGNLTADIQSVRKSSWLCLRNIRTFRIRSLNPSPLHPGSSGYCLLPDDFISFQTGFFALLHRLFPILWPPDVKSWLTETDPNAGKDWGQDEKGATEDEMAGWHHRLNGHEFKQTPGDREGQGSLACCSPWARKESDRLSYSPPPPPPSPAVSPRSGQSDLLQHLSDRASSSEGTPPSGQWVLLTPRLAFYHCSHWPGVPPHVLIWFVHFIPSVPSTNITFHATPVLTTL